MCYWSFELCSTSNGGNKGIESFYVNFYFNNAVIKCPKRGGGGVPPMEKSSVFMSAFWYETELWMDKRHGVVISAFPGQYLP